MKIGIVGSTGEVGRKMIKLLEEYNIPVRELHLYASERSMGKEIIFKGEKLKVKRLTTEALMDKYDYVLFSAGASVSKEFAPIAAKNGATVIDNSSAFRMDPSIPLVVPEINSGLLKGYKGIIANPNCSTIQMVLSLYKLHQHYSIDEIVVSTYQSVSGAGYKGIRELENQINGSTETNVFPKQILHNVIPLIGEIKDNGFTQEEMKMINETRKILNDNSIKIYPTTVRVPVIYGHSESIFVKLRNEFNNIEEVKKIIESGENVKVVDDVITPIDVADNDITFVCRVRAFDKNSILFWNVADNIRVGAATNAVRILIKHMNLNGMVKKDG